jgi:hypothetical protein
VDPFQRRRPAEGRLVPRREILAQAVAEGAVELVVSALDVNAVLDLVDLNAVLDRIDLDGLLERVDLNSIVERLDIDALVEQTDLGAPSSPGPPAGLRAMRWTWSAARSSGSTSSSPAGWGGFAAAPTPARPARPAGCGPRQGHDGARG